MPLGERIKAGDVYIREGGNGEVKHLYQYLLNKEIKVANHRIADLENFHKQKGEL